MRVKADKVGTDPMPASGSGSFHVIGCENTLVAGDSHVKITRIDAERVEGTFHIDEIAANLQACSYDGSPVAFSPSGMKMGVNADGRDVVAGIVRFTGAGALAERRTYAFIAREDSLSRNPEDSPSFSLLRYDLRD